MFNATMDFIHWTVLIRFLSSFLIMDNSDVTLTKIITRHLSKFPIIKIRFINYLQVL